MIFCHGDRGACHRSFNAFHSPRPSRQSCPVYSAPTSVTIPDYDIRCNSDASGVNHRIPLLVLDTISASGCAQQPTCVRSTMNISFFRPNSTYRSDAVKSNAPGLGCMIPFQNIFRADGIELRLDERDGIGVLVSELVLLSAAR